MALTPTRSETAANWASSNPVLVVNEVGIESDTGVVKVGDGVRTWARLNVADNQATSAQKSASTSDETGIGAQVYATSPTLVTPVLGVASATSINGTTIPTSKTLVDTTTAAVLTNKTLTSPVITGNIGGAGAAPTIASAATIAPTTAILFVSGITGIDTITAPAPISTTGGSIVIIPTGVFITSLAGNIALATTSVVNRALRMTYDPTTTKWYPSY